MEELTQERRLGRKSVISKKKWMKEKECLSEKLKSREKRIGKK